MPLLWEKTEGRRDSQDVLSVDLSTLVISKPTVVYFPGRESTDDNRDEISKNLRFVNKIFHDQPEAPQIYCWSHPKKYSTQKKGPLGDKRGLLPALFHALSYDYAPRYRYTSSANDLAKSLIMPLVTDAEGNRLSAGQFGQAQKNLRNLTFMSHCVGAVAAQELYNVSTKMMKKSGYTPEETRELLHEIVLISYATFSRPKKEKDRYTTLTFVNSDDRLLQIKNLLVPSFNGIVLLSNIFSNASRKLKIRVLSDTSILVSAAARGRVMSNMLRKQPKEIIDDVTLPRGKLMASNHDPRDYGFNPADTTSQFSGMVPYAAIKAVNRTATNAIQLLEPPENASEQYRRKIIRALPQLAT